MHRFEVFQYRVFNKFTNVGQLLTSQYLSVCAGHITLVRVLVLPKHKVKLSLGQITTEAKEPDRQREKVVDVHPLQDAVTVLIPEEGFRLVLRVDLVPLAEMRALAQKASQTYDHGDEGWDCGAKPAKKPAQAVNDEEDED